MSVGRMSRMKEATNIASSMSSGSRRTIGIVGGVALIILGASFGGGGWALTVVGLVLIHRGVFDVCSFAPILGPPISGITIRGLR